MCARERAHRESAAEEERVSRELVKSFERLFEMRRAWMRREIARWQQQHLEFKARLGQSSAGTREDHRVSDATGGRWRHFLIHVCFRAEAVGRAV
jgi:hypothetical protein